MLNSFLKNIFQTHSCEKSKLPFISILNVLDRCLFPIELRNCSLNINSSWNGIESPTNSLFYRAQHISNGNQNSSLDVKIVVINCLALALMLREFFFGAVICTISHITISSSTYPMTNGKLYYWRHVRATHEKLGWPFFRGFLFFLNSPKSDKKLSSPRGMDVLLWARALSSNSMAKK